MALHFNQGTKGYFNLTTAVFCQMAALSYIVYITHQKAWLDKGALRTTPHIDMEVIWSEIGFYPSLMCCINGDMSWGNSHEVYEEWDVVFCSALELYFCFLKYQLLGW